MKKKSKSSRRGKFCKREQRGLEGFDVLELDENDEWKSDEQCYSIIDFYPRNDQEEQKIKSDLKTEELQIESPKQTKRDSEISFLRPSQINIAKSECEKIFKKLEAFHEKKGRKGEDDDDDTKKSRKFKKNNKKGSDNEKGKGGKKKGGKFEGDEEEDEDEDDEEDDEEREETDVCANLVEKEPEWSVEWVEQE